MHEDALDAMHSQMRRTFKYVFTTAAIFFMAVYCFLLYLPESRVQFDFDLTFNNALVEFSQDRLNSNFDLCLFIPHVLEQNISGISEVKNYDSNFTRYDYLNLLSTEDKFQRFPLFQVVLDLSTLMLDNLNLEVVLLEPSLLFCMLSEPQRDLLLRRNFTLDPYLKHKKIVTLGMRAEHTHKLHKKNVKSKIQAAGFTMDFVKGPLPQWMWDKSLTFEDKHYNNHIFFKRMNWTLHVVVLHTRNTYFWHEALKQLPNQNLPSIADLFFVESDSAYERFELTSLGFAGLPLRSIHIPSHPQYFLFEMQNSRFIECNLTIESQFKVSSGLPVSHSSLTVTEFNQRALMSIQQLKQVLNPPLIHFWIWSGTMLGWYRQCDVIPYTTDMDFGAFASEVDDLQSVLRSIHGNGHLALKEKMGIVETGLEFNMNCYGLRVDLFFLYPESNGTWYAGHRPDKAYYFKYHHPNFSLCSTELLNQKVLVPCETESVIATEYGAKWMTPVANWHWEKSAYNRGPNIYWEEKLRKIAYEAYH